ncbi:hypothetical protein [Arsenicibacter rosenii]|uniref:Uncharacterized protein n=1 Tax=Arsenicibacter rosenii TaxID=1750698 RepID=A0A1S2VPK6_9BACT|nr:hypothetical protein [Arsenicibacter rosenii]OIN60175.1 hypothetical protein BLX24_04885 [Arsenicibacter rosenii]
MLTNDQLAAIDRHLRKDNWLLNEDLIAELTDHYANAITEAVANGQAFDSALANVHHSFGERKGLLSMEETYQTEKAKHLDTMVWREVRRMMQGDRWPLVPLTLCTLLVLNTFAGASEYVDGFFMIAIWYVGFTILSAMVTAAISLLRPATISVTAPTPSFFVFAYGLSLALLAVNKYWLSGLSVYNAREISLMINTLLQTLCVVYYIAIIFTMRKFFFPKKGSTLSTPKHG